MCPDGFVYNLETTSSHTYVANGVVVHNCHHACAGTWVKVFAAYPDAMFLGVTATPERLDGKGLGEFFHRIVLGPRVAWLIENGFLSRPRYFAPSHTIDVSGLKMTAGDFNKKDATEIVDRPSITGDAVEHYRRIASGRTAIAFCMTVAHAEHVAAQFCEAGIRAEVIDGTMGDDQRTTILDRLRARTTMVLVSVDLVSEGFDLPAVGAVILLRLTASLALHLQQIGRGLRPAPGKIDTIILDHVGNCSRHGLAEEDREWSLEGHSAKKRKKEAILETKQCPECYAIHAGPRCPECGATRKAAVRAIEQVDGQLREFTAEELQAKRLFRDEEAQCSSLNDFRQLALRRGYKPGWAWFRWQNSWKSKLQKKAA